MSLSIGINAIVQLCTNDLNDLLRLIKPNAKKLSWTDWYNIMQSGSTLITCFDDSKSRVIGMTTIVPHIRPSGKFAQICDTTVSTEYDTVTIEAELTRVAKNLIRKYELSLISMCTHVEFDAYAIEEECAFLINETQILNKEDRRREVGNFFSALKIGMIEDANQLDSFVQEIEVLIGYNPDFIERFRQCVHCLYESHLNTAK